ncbi:MAG: hypothetical protein GAK31_02382 [Stenotrophomonas maltophilia]|uniref:Uncharacterized protein n=1 Tax=Stenotrophomonas maltophilia TaxID=40324 RepID=A0A7V8FG74_STEMA|nr:MAG: hypothetical protein GAK31_02382 [Stenotrophomonas maltophilia]
MQDERSRASPGFFVGSAGPRPASAQRRNQKLTFTEPAL